VERDYLKVCAYRYTGSKYTQPVSLLEIQELVLSLGDVVGSEDENEMLTAAANRFSESVSLLL